MNASTSPPSAFTIIFRLTTYQNAAYLSEDENESLNSSIYRVPNGPFHWDKLHSG